MQVDSADLDMKKRGLSQNGDHEFLFWVSVVHVLHCGVVRACRFENFTSAYQFVNLAVDPQFKRTQMQR